MMQEEKYDAIYRAARHLKQKYSLPLSHALIISSSQFEFVAHVMKKSDFEAVRLPYMGTFKVKHGRLRKYDNRKMDQFKKVEKHL